MEFKFNKSKAIKHIEALRDKESNNVFVPSLGSNATKSINK